MDAQTAQTLKGDSMIEVSVDWRGKPCRPNKHGGMRAAAFVLAIQAFEIMAIAAVGNNLITYVFNEMHFPLSNSANVVTNFIGTVFLLSSSVDSSRIPIWGASGPCSSSDLWSSQASSSCQCKHISHN
ncbi:Peptide transporter [Musa troglodytarum]|uniref:Peptide transporter n=1 Tax=Musa troglodytarum TaxID=320322 RepID=A0A9E7KUY5_9LILI|nr:Peptide transporter [Musa troglodytarum]